MLTKEQQKSLERMEKLERNLNKNSKQRYKMKKIIGYIIGLLIGIIVFIIILKNVENSFFYALVAGVACVFFLGNYISKEMLFGDKSYTVDENSNENDE